MNPRTNDTLHGSLLLALALVFITAPAFATASATTEMSVADARPPGDAREQFYDFDEQVIDGNIKGPNALVVDTRPHFERESLISLKKKSFLPAIMESHHDMAMR